MGVWVWVCGDAHHVVSCTFPLGQWYTSNELDMHNASQNLEKGIGSVHPQTSQKKNTPIASITRHGKLYEETTQQTDQKLQAGDHAPSPLHLANGPMGIPNWHNDNVMTRNLRQKVQKQNNPSRTGNCHTCLMVLEIFRRLGDVVPREKRDTQKNTNKQKQTKKEIGVLWKGSNIVFYNLSERWNSGHRVLLEIEASNTSSPELKLLSSLLTGMKACNSI